MAGGGRGEGGPGRGPGGGGAGAGRQGRRGRGQGRGRPGSPTGWVRRAAGGLGAAKAARRVLGLAGWPSAGKLLGGGPRLPPPGQQGAGTRNNNNNNSRRGRGRRGGARARGGAGGAARGAGECVCVCVYIYIYGDRKEARRCRHVGGGNAGRGGRGGVAGAGRGGARARARARARAGGGAGRAGGGRYAGAGGGARRWRVPPANARGNNKARARGGGRRLPGWPGATGGGGRYQGGGDGGGGGWGCMHIYIVRARARVVQRRSRIAFGRSARGGRRGTMEKAWWTGRGRPWPPRGDARIGSRRQMDVLSACNAGIGHATAADAAPPGPAGGLAAPAPALVLWGYTVDDALISVRYAHHLAPGQGWRFNAGGPATDGVTPLAWPLLLAPVARAPRPSWCWAARSSWDSARPRVTAVAVGRRVGGAGEAPVWLRAAIRGPLALGPPSRRTR